MNAILSKEYIIEQFNLLKYKIGKVPSRYDLEKERKINDMIPTQGDIIKVFGGMGSLKKELHVPTFKAYDRDILIKLLQDYCKESKNPIYWRDFTGKKNLPDYRIFQECFKFSNIMELYKICNIKLLEEEIYLLSKDDFSKEKVIDSIRKMQFEVNRPLMYSDFKGSQVGQITVSSIKKYFGSMNKMKLELGLEIVQESMMDKIKSVVQMKSDLDELCEEIYQKENRKIITLKDIDRCSSIMSSSCYSRHLKLENSSLRIYIESIGFQLQAEGNGLNYTFEDGEKVRSQYELDFSKLLRDKLNFQYNKDYTRDIRYKEFIPNYTGLLDCDYVIEYKNRKIYLEIAGMLRDHKSNFVNNKEVSSKSKEKYRQHLILKDNMLKENNLEYYILFPSDLQEDFLLSIFQNNKQISA